MFITHYVLKPSVFIINSAQPSSQIKPIDQKDQPRMAQLSPNEVEIVLSHLVGEALEPFRQSYHSTCDKLGVANSLESVKEVVSSKGSV